MTAEVPPGGWDRPIPSQPLHRASLAGWWSRVAAALVDVFLISIPAIMVGALIFGGVTAAFTADDGVGIAAAVVGVLVYLVLFFVAAIFYAPLLMRREGARNGQTWGKQLLGIRVIRANGVPIDFTWAALREAVVKGLGLGIASTFIPVLPYLLDALWPLFDDENRALHDMLVDTRVVQA